MTLGAPWMSSVVWVFPLAVGVLVGLALRSRSPAGRRNPAAYFYLTMTLIFLIVGITTAGVGVYAVAQLIGPAPAPLFGIGCVALSCTTFYPSGIALGRGEMYANAIAYSPHDVAIATAVGAGLFLAVALFGYLVAWPRARRVGGEILASYRYLVAGLAVVTLLIVVPLSAFSVFEAVDPTVAGLRGHAPGTRTLIALAVVSALVGVAFRYHLGMVSSETSEPDQ
jgi:hypothetical protein